MRRVNICWLWPTKLLPFVYQLIALINNARWVVDLLYFIGHFSLLVPSMTHMFGIAVSKRASVPKQGYRGPISSLHGIDFGSQSAPPPSGLALINELEVRRCFCAGHFGHVYAAHHFICLVRSMIMAWVCVWATAHLCVRRASDPQFWLLPH